MTEFVNDCQAYLFADFGIVVADGFDILLIKNDVVRSRGKVKGALFRSGQTVKKAQKQLPLVLQLFWRLAWWKILHENSDVTYAIAELAWKRVECFLDYLDEIFAFHFLDFAFHRPLEELR